MKTFQVKKIIRDEKNYPLETKTVGTVKAKNHTEAMRIAAKEFNNDNYANISVIPVITKVNKSDYEVFSFNSGYFGICKKGSHGGECVYGGDSACEDHYNEQSVKDIFDSWDGSLHYTGDKYGYTIEG
jgi:hypothetical protein